MGRGTQSAGRLTESTRSNTLPSVSQSVGHTRFTAHCALVMGAAATWFQRSGKYRRKKYRGSGQYDDFLYDDFF